MQLQSTRGTLTDQAKAWMVTDEYSLLVDTCVLFDSKLDESRRALSAKVADRCVAIAGALELGDVETVQLELAARVHRVGELYLHESLRNKSFLDMSGAEMGAYRQYPVFSAFRLSDDARVICDVILKHREYCSGRGFLRDERSARVPLAARILCVATEYEELMMYRGNSLERQDTIQRRMRKNAARRYDSKVIDALMLTLVAEHIVHHAG